MSLANMLAPDTRALFDQLGISSGTIEAALASLAFLTVLTVATAIPTAIVARKKGRSGPGWLLLALSIPVLPLLLVWLLPKLPDKPEE